MNKYVFFLIIIPTVIAVETVEVVLQEMDTQNLGRSYAVEGEFPYQANLIIVNPDDDSEENCSGSIIHSRWILTAAHCLRSLVYPKYLLINVGTTNFSGLGGEPYEYEAIVPHANWNNDPINDIALIRVKKNITITEKIQLIKLNKNDTMTYENSVTTLSSWGQVDNCEPAGTLQSTKLTVISQNRCREELMALIGHLEDFQSDRDFFTRAVHNLRSLICTNSDTNNRKLCHGDSGGPLVVNSTQIGIVSSSYKCNGHPGLLTKVSSFIDWIQYQIGRYSDVLP